MRRIAKNEGNTSLIDRQLRAEEYVNGNKRIISVPLIIGIIIASASTIYNSVYLFLQNIGFI